MRTPSASALQAAASTGLTTLTRKPECETDVDGCRVPRQHEPQRARFYHRRFVAPVGRTLTASWIRTTQSTGGGQHTNTLRVITKRTTGHMTTRKQRVYGAGSEARNAMQRLAVHT
jgi:hypothetical protein